MSHIYKRHNDLVRMLNLLPYFKAHPGRSMMEAAADLGSTPTQVRDDLSRLFCCGPGTFPDQLVDMEASLASVQILDSQGMDQPLRLTRTEAAALLLALENLENVPGLVDRTAVVSAANKLRDIMGMDTVAVFDSEGHGYVPETDLDVIRESMERRKQLTFTYNSAYRGAVESRTVSAARIYTFDSQVYLTAWDHDKEKHLTFRLDRISNPQLTDDVATPRAQEIPFDPKDPFGFKKADTKATIAVEKESIWVTEGLPIELGEEDDHGRILGTLPLVDEDWLIHFALSNADRVTVITPSNVATQVSLRAQSGLSLYDLPLNE